ncbi:MAG TPA: DegT/DnrJ/EryC1/StrS family aminotransferase [Geminicoccaceae bacterium]|nr:DegT/DnrJ/EryC1/StrS family aminotransferase [Geminicoccaceae bacterium]
MSQTRAFQQGAEAMGERAASPVPWQRPPLKATLVSKPALHRNAEAYVLDVLRSGWWGYGPVAQHLQKTVEELYAQRQNALATSSCTAAMHLALRAAGVGPGDEVIVPAFTYVSTAIVAVYCGAEPVFADIDPRTLTITAETVEPLLSPRTRAIIPMHYAGPPADFDPIRQLVAGRDITVVEDAAHAFGSIRDGQRVGADADFVAFSFAPTKQIASSNGGLLLYKDGERRTEINQLAFLGLAADTYNRTVARGVSPTQHVARVGHKYKIDDLAAAVAYAGIEQLDEIVAHRAALVERYYRQLEDLEQVELLPRRTNAAISWYILPIRVPPARRDGLRAHLAERNIDSTVHYPNLLEQPAFRDCRGEVPNTVRETSRVISLPLHRNLADDEVDRICDSVRSFLA